MAFARAVNRYLGIQIPARHRWSNCHCSHHRALHCMHNILVDQSLSRGIWYKLLYIIKMKSEQRKTDQLAGSRRSLIFRKSSMQSRCGNIVLACRRKYGKMSSTCPGKKKNLIWKQLTGNSQTDNQTKSVGRELNLIFFLLDLIQFIWFKHR